jgi:SAM-dependent methyltransferase
MTALANDAFVMLDPAVETLETGVGEYRLLCHGHFELGMAIPPGEGLLAFVAALAGEPVKLATLRRGFDDQRLIDKMLETLFRYGFVHVTGPERPSIEELARSRDEATRRGRTPRRVITVDLDAPLALESLRVSLAAAEVAPELSLRCAKLADHRAALAELADGRQAGATRLYRTVVRTGDLAADGEILQSLIGLGASVLLEGVSWPAPDHTIPGLDEMTRACIAVRVMMTCDLSILDETTRARSLAWAGSRFISGLHLRLEADALWPAGAGSDGAFSEVFDAVRALEMAFGDIVIDNLPSDEVLLGNAAPISSAMPLSDLGDRFRIAYLRRRIPFLKSCEGDNTWSQTPEAEEKLVRVEEDLLPNNPDLLSLGSGSVVVDVCGGLGRVARRLSPAVGRRGLIISIEMSRCVSDRACSFATERNMTNLQFRTGLAQRIPLPDAAVDAAVNEWTGAIWELGLGPAMVREMTRVVRPGGRIAVSHRLVRLPLARLGQPWVQYDKIHQWMTDAFRQPELTIVRHCVWGQTASSLVGENATLWRKQYLPLLINPHDMIYGSDKEPGDHADVYLTIIAQRH